MTNNETIKAIRELPEGVAVEMSDEYGVGFLPTKLTTDDLKALADSVPRWIPVSERLPEGGNSCLVTDNDGDVWEAWVTPEGKWAHMDGGEFIFGAIAWMPLPSPYQEGKQND